MINNMHLNIDIDLYKLDNFNWYYKDLFIWNNYSFSFRRRIVFFGTKKNDPDFKVVLKKIRVNNNYEHILKEIYFLVCCKNLKQFIQIIDIFLTDDKNFIFLIFKEEGTSLQNLIEYENIEDFDYKKIDGFIKHIIFQIVYALRILHNAKLIHNDIKPSNILINSIGTTKICDFGSVDKPGNTRYSTIYYSSPDALLQKESSEKDDMWSVGVIMIELYKRISNFFDFNSFSTELNKLSKKELQLKSILSNYTITINNKKYDIKEKNDFDFIKNEIIKNNNYDNFEAKLNLDGIPDSEAIELINNLLEINPEKRFSSQQALDSKYLSEFKKEIKDIDKIEKIYRKEDYIILLEKVSNLDKFVKNVELIKQKFLGQVLFD